MKWFIEWLDNLILKYHKCKNHMELYSKTWETFGNNIICTDIEYRCSICGKSNKVMH